MWQLFISYVPESIWLFYRGPGFLSVIWFGSPPTGDIQEEQEREATSLGGGGEKGGGGAKSYDGDKAWSSINHSTLSCMYYAPGTNP